ncbi:MAG: T9SS type A sorting domain-containing protein [Bacteroidetes bacterium]|nr:T9SS type A sorting domain-containing protein [Bacteroidota bacterium]
MDGMLGAQTEGICFKNGYNALLSCEKSIIDQQVFKLNIAIWTDTTFCFLPELNEDLLIRVHPNPVRSDKLRIDVFQPGEEQCFINIYDLLGRSMLAQKHKINSKRKKTTLSLGIGEITPGIYMLHVIAGNSYAIEKIIIE